MQVAESNVAVAESAPRAIIQTWSACVVRTTAEHFKR